MSGIRDPVELRYFYLNLHLHLHPLFFSNYYDIFGQFSSFYSPGRATAVSNSSWLQPQTGGWLSTPFETAVESSPMGSTLSRGILPAIAPTAVSTAVGLAAAVSNGSRHLKWRLRYSFDKIKNRHFLFKKMYKKHQIWSQRFIQSEESG